MGAFVAGFVGFFALALLGVSIIAGRVSGILLALGVLALCAAAL